LAQGKSARVVDGSNARATKQAMTNDAVGLAFSNLGPVQAHGSRNHASANMQKKTKVNPGEPNQLIAPTNRQMDFSNPASKKHKGRPIPERKPLIPYFRAMITALLKRKKVM